jgi:hypothetical protein
VEEEEAGVLLVLSTGHPTQTVAGDDGDSGNASLRVRVVVDRLLVETGRAVL